MNRYIVELIVIGPEGTATQATEMWADDPATGVYAAAMQMAESIGERLEQGNPGQPEDLEAYKEAKPKISAIANAVYLERRRRTS